MKGKFKLGVVFWKDATLYTSEGDPELTECKTAGWVQIKKDKIIIVSSFTDGRPDVFLVVPKSWVNEVIFITSKGGENGKENQTT